MDLFGMSPDQYAAAAAWFTAAAAVGTFIVVSATAWFARGQLNEARRLRLEQTRPFVTVSVEIEQRFMFMLAVSSVGKVTARNVRVTFDEMPHSSDQDLGEVRMFREPIPTMPPGHRYAVHWESALAVFDEEKPYEHPLTYRAEVTYEDQEGRRYGPEEYVLDLRTFEGQAAGQKGLPDLVKAVEELHTEHAKWTSGGLLVRTLDELKKERRGYRPVLIGRALRAKDKGGWRELVRFLVDQYRRRHGLYERPGWRRR